MNKILKFLLGLILVIAGSYLVGVILAQLFPQFLRYPVFEADFGYPWSAFVIVAILVIVLIYRLGRVKKGGK